MALIVFGNFMIIRICALIFFIVFKCMDLILASNVKTKPIKYMLRSKKNKNKKKVQNLVEVEINIKWN